MTHATLPIYIDMDGTIADFYGAPNALKRFEHERDFFYNLKPLEKNLQAVRNAIAHGYNVYIITASPNFKADSDKMKWLSRHLNELKEGHLIITRIGDNKLEAMPTESGVLFDDYGKNCREWCANPQNRAVKVRQDGDIAIGLQALKVLKEQYLNS